MPDTLWRQLQVAPFAYHQSVVSCLQAEEATEAQAQAVQFRTNREVAFGDAVRVVGGAPQLGDWDAASAPGEVASAATPPLSEPVCRC